MCDQTLKLFENVRIVDFGYDEISPYNFLVCLQSSQFFYVQRRRDSA